MTATAYSRKPGWSAAPVHPCRALGYATSNTPPWAMTTWRDERPLCPTIFHAEAASLTGDAFGDLEMLQRLGWTVTVEAKASKLLITLRQPRRLR